MGLLESMEFVDLLLNLVTPSPMALNHLGGANLFAEPVDPCLVAVGLLAVAAWLKQAGPYYLCLSDPELLLSELWDLASHLLVASICTA